MYNRLFGFLLGAVGAGAGTYYYILQEYRVSNELLTEDIFVGSAFPFRLLSGLTQLCAVFDHLPLLCLARKSEWADSQVECGREWNGLFWRRAWAVGGVGCCQGHGLMRPRTEITSSSPKDRELYEELGGEGGGDGAEEDLGVVGCGYSCSCGCGWGL